MKNPRLDKFRKLDGKPCPNRCGKTTLRLTNIAESIRLGAARLHFPICRVELACPICKYLEVLDSDVLESYQRALSQFWEERLLKTLTPSELDKAIKAVRKALRGTDPSSDGSVGGTLLNFLASKGRRSPDRPVGL